MITDADESYLKEIYTLSLDNDWVTTSMLADAMGFSPPTVTGMLKKLAENQWVVYEPYQGVQLTNEGKQIAIKVLRRHRILESFLVTVLKVPWEKVHPEAERMEHVLSDDLADRMEEHLGFPATDPHGAPIPSLSGDINQSSRLYLSHLNIGDRAEILEVNDRNPDLLNRLEQMNLYPGDKIGLNNIEPIDGLMTIEHNDQLYIFGQNSANQILVRKIE
jgi:DtxR family transcriptional regulator, Mn-dependent transcriptional regulator